MVTDSNRNMPRANTFPDGWVEPSPAMLGEINLRPRMRGSTADRRTTAFHISAYEAGGISKAPASLHHQDGHIPAGTAAKFKRIPRGLDANILAPHILDCAMDEYSHVIENSCFLPRPGRESRACEPSPQCIHLRRVDILEVGDSNHLLDSGN